MGMGGGKEKGAQEKWGCRDESEWGYAYGKSSNESDPFLFFALSSTKKSFQVPYFSFHFARNQMTKRNVVPFSEEESPLP